MEAVQKAVSDAVHAVRNSPLLRRRFGGRENTTEEVRVEEPSRAISPVKDRTPFIQGFSYRVEYLGKAIVEAGQEQDHGCTDRAVALLWTESKSLPHPLNCVFHSLWCVTSVKTDCASYALRYLGFKKVWSEYNHSLKV